MGDESVVYRLMLSDRSDPEPCSIQVASAKNGLIANTDKGVFVFINYDELVLFIKAYFEEDKKNG